MLVNEADLVQFVAAAKYLNDVSGLKWSSFANFFHSLQNFINHKTAFFARKE